jgi:copper resistance protein B
MKKALILLALSTATPAIAQHAGHAMSGTATGGEAADPHAGHQMPAADPHAGHAMPAQAPAAPQETEPAKSAPHAGHVMPAPPPAATEPPGPHAGHVMPETPKREAADPHAGHQMPAADPHAGHAMPPAAAPAKADPHAGHDMSATPAAADPHAGHAMATQSPAPPAGPPPPAALAGPAHAADTVFAPAAMAEAREQVRAEHGGMNAYKFTVDQLEVAVRKGRDGYAWEDVQFWYGGDLNKLWLKSEGEGTFGEGVESAEVQALWSRAVAPFFDLQAGLRYDIRPKPDRAHLVLGLQGLAPYWFEIDAAAFLSDKGDLTARLEGEYDLRVTQQLILQPRVEVELAAQDVPELGIGSGLSTAEAGLRLRYEFVPEFAPYVGVEYQRAFGDTADFRRAEGEDAGGWSLVLGVRAWF